MRPVLLFACLVSVLAAPVRADGEHAGRRAPGFSIMDVNYNQHDLADYRGKVVLVEFSRTDCPVCQTFTGIVDRIRATFGDRVAVLTIVTTPPDNQATVQKFIESFKVRNPILFDCGQVAASFLRLHPARPRLALPNIFLVDAKGAIRNNWEYRPGSNEDYFTGDAPGLFSEIGKLVAEIAPVPAQQ